MTKNKTLFFCQECGNDSPKWQGRCPACGAWNSMVEEAVRPAPRRSGASKGRKGIEPSRPRPITEIPPDEGQRLLTGIDEFDRVLGGGVVEGSAVLLGGEPGIGKSTLMLQVACRLAQRTAPAGVLYVTGEESARQTRMRAERLGAFDKSLFVQCETQVETILETLEKTQPAVAVIDSIQTLSSGDVASAPGSVSQIRDCAAQLVRVAKETGLALFFIGHVTKEGIVAGPRLLEHMVDTVLYFEGERHFSYRILRAVKNRFGSTNEIGIFEMTDKGLETVANPSEIFLSERPAESAGSVVLAAIEGTRPLLVEVQALVSPNGGFAAPRRSAHGMDARRLALILAVLEKRVGLPLSNQDVFVNVAGGLKIEEPALDLAAAAAVAGSALGRPVEKGTVVFGEVGLAGEIRSVGQFAKRLAEARRLGFDSCIYGAPRREKPRREDGISLHPASTLDEALRLLGLGKT
ncbi:DNA repair protein RadA [Candidatus Sumerlaeota bacterium]|nr:DNA repair protein RadA [Candidatus Sumerlaeota bacterium]